MLYEVITNPRWISFTVVFVISPFRSRHYVMPRCWWLKMVAGSSAQHYVMRLGCNTLNSYFLAITLCSETLRDFGIGVSVYGESRITSYNVCYTKLLRLDTKAGPIFDHCCNFIHFVLMLNSSNELGNCHTSIYSNSFGF